MNTFESELVQTHPRHAGVVQRYHTWPTLNNQSIDAHSWHVMRIYYELWKEVPAYMFVYMLYHDVNELKMGDTPTYAKMKDPESAERAKKAEADATYSIIGQDLPILSEEEHRRFKIADILERWEFAHFERNMGNKYTYGIFENVHADLKRRNLTLYEKDIVAKFQLESTLAEEPREVTFR